MIDSPSGDDDRQRQPDRHPDDHPPRWPLLVVVWVLLPIAIVGTGVLSAAATLYLFARHGVPAAVQPFGLGMVEVVSLSGTLLAIFAITGRLRHRAMLAVVAASTVSMTAGWQAYGWVGLLAGAFLVYLVHLAAEAWRELRTHWRLTAADASDRQDQPDSAVQVSASIPESAPAPLRDTGTLDDPAAETEVLPVLPVLEGIDPATVAAAASLLAAEPKAGRPRLRSELGVTDHAAKRLLAALRPMRAVEGGEVA